MKEDALNKENVELAKLNKEKAEEQKALMDAAQKLANTKTEL